MSRAIDDAALAAAHALAARQPQAKLGSILGTVGSVVGGPVGGLIGSTVGGLFGNSSGGQSAGSSIGSALGSGAASQAAASQYQQAAIAAANAAYAKQQQTSASTMNDLQSRIAALKNPATAPQSAYLLNPNQLQQVGAPQASTVLGSAPGQVAPTSTPQMPAQSSAIGGTQSVANPTQSFAPTNTFGAAATSAGLPNFHGLASGANGGDPNPSYLNQGSQFVFNGDSGIPADAVSASTLAGAENQWNQKYKSLLRPA